jgi:hypothetical protein
MHLTVVMAYQILQSACAVEYTSRESWNDILDLSQEEKHLAVSK